MPHQASKNYQYHQIHGYKRAPYKHIKLPCGKTITWDRSMLTFSYHHVAVVTDPANFGRRRLKYRPMPGGES